MVSSNDIAGGPGHPVAVAQILRRNAIIYGLDTHLCILYIPKGPLLDWTDTALRRRVLSDLARIAHQQHAIFIKIDPDVLLATGFPGSPEDTAEPHGEAIIADMMSLGWRYSTEQIQFRNTIRIDISRHETELLADMKQKTRYNMLMIYGLGGQHK